MHIIIFCFLQKVYNDSHRDGLLSLWGKSLDANLGRNPLATSPKPWVFIDLRTVYRDKVSKSDDVWWTLGRSDRDGKDLVVHTVVVHV